MIKLGQTVRDRITGISGIAVARTEWLHGCIRITFQPTKLRDGKPDETVTIDEAQLEVLKGKSMFPAPSTARPAGPKPAPTHRPAPTR